MQNDVTALLVEVLLSRKVALLRRHIQINKVERLGPRVGKYERLRIDEKDYTTSRDVDISVMTNASVRLSTAFFFANFLDCNKGWDCVTVVPVTGTLPALFSYCRYQDDTLTKKKPKRKVEMLIEGTT